VNGGYRGGQGSGRGSRYGGPDGEDGSGAPQRPGRPSDGSVRRRDQNGARAAGAGDGYGGQGYPGQQGSWPPAGGSPAQRPQPPGYDQRGAQPRRAAGRYDDEYQYGQGGSSNWGDRGDESFLPGFGGGRDDSGTRGRGRDPRVQDPRERDPRDPRGGRGDGRRPGGPGGRGPGGRGPDDRDGGWPDPGGRDSRDREAWSEFHTEKRRRSPVRRLAPWVALLVILTPIVIGVLYVYHRYEAKYHPADYAGPGTGEVTVQVMSGDTAFSLAQRLVTLGVVASSRAFENAAESAPANGPGLEAGFFELHHHMQASLAYATLINPKNMVQTVVTIPEGKRVSQIISILSAKTKIPAKDFQAVIDHPAQLGLPSYAKGLKGFPDSAVEGFLFPATYAITPNETPLQILRAMVQRFNSDPAVVNIAAEARSVHLTPYQLLIEASMAQAEGGSVSDYPKIATVIKNRLAAGMTMGFDSVLFYGLNTYGINVSKQQEAMNNPYNDMTEHTGLPPTPIDNPGDTAIQGILHPTPGNWLYFLTNTGGKSTFSHTPLQGQ